MFYELLVISHHQCVNVVVIAIVCTFLHVLQHNLVHFFCPLALLYFWLGFRLFYVRRSFALFVLLSLLYTMAKILHCVTGAVMMISVSAAPILFNVIQIFFSHEILIFQTEDKQTM